MTGAPINWETEIYDPRDRHARAERPSSRWRNRWRAYGFGAVVCSVCETYTFYEPGAEFENHCRTFPCQDTALAWAADNPLKGTAHLGAFPIEADA